LFVGKIVTSNKISNSNIFCIDEIGFLERESQVLENLLKTFPKFEIPIILVIQKRILKNFQPFFQTPPWQLYDLDFAGSNSVRTQIISLLKT